MRKKTLSIVAALFMCACGAWAAVNPGTAFRLSNPEGVGDNRGYMVGYEGNTVSGITLVGMGQYTSMYTANWPTTLNGEGVQAYWAVYTSDNNTYLYNVDNGKFLNLSNISCGATGKGAALTDNAMPVEIEEFDSYVRIKTDALQTGNYLNFAPYWGSVNKSYGVFDAAGSDKAANIVIEYAEGVEIAANIKNLVEQKVKEYEGTPVVEPEKTFDANNAYTLFAQKSQRGYLASWTGESNYVSLAGVTLVAGGIDYSTKHPALDAEGVAIKWEINEETVGKVTFKNLANGKYLANVNGKAKWSDSPTEFSYTKEADGSYHFENNNNFLTAACGYAENAGAVLIKGHEDASDFVVTKVDRDTENPDIDADLAAAKADFEKYIEEVVAPILEEMEDISEDLYTDEFNNACEELSAKMFEYYDIVKNEYIPLASVAAYETAKQELSALIENYKKTKPNIPGEASDAQKAFKAAYNELKALVDQYVAGYDEESKSYTFKVENLSDDAKNELIEDYWTIIGYAEDSAGYPESDEAFASSTGILQEALADLQAALDATPAAPVFPAAGDYYVYIKNYDTARNPYLYNNVDEATGYTLQAANLDNANNGYIWHVTSDGEGKITNIVSGTGKGVGVNGGSKPVLSELDYEDAGEGYYYIGNSVLGDSKWLNASNGGQNNGKGTRTVTNYSKENASKWTFETVNMENLTAYNVVVEGNEEGCAILGNNYAGNNGFFLASDVANVTAKEIEHYTTEITKEGNTVKVVYTATAEPIKVTYKVYVDNDIVSGFEKMEYAGDAPSFSAADVPSYVTAQIPEVIPADGNVEIHSSYNETLPFTVGGNVTFTLWNKPVSFDGTNFVDSVAEPTEDASTFTVGGDWFNGFTLFNKQANGYLTYGTVVSPGDNTKSTATQSADEPGAHLDLVAHNGAFFFRIHGTENNSYMNDRGGFVSTWNNAASLSADGSKVVFTEIEDIPEVDPAIAEAKAALDKYMEEKVYPLMEAIEELDEKTYALLKEQIDALGNAVNDYEYDDLPTDAEGYNALLATFQGLVKNYNDAKNSIPTEATEAQKAFEAAYDELRLLCNHYVQGWNENNQFVFKVEGLSSELQTELMNGYSAVLGYAEGAITYPKDDAGFETATTLINEAIASIKAAIASDPMASSLEDFYATAGEWVESLTAKYGHVSPTESAANEALMNLYGTLVGYAYLDIPKNKEEIDAAYAAIKAAIKEFYESCTIEQLSKIIGQENVTLEDIENIKKGILRTIDVDELYKTEVTE